MTTYLFVTDPESYSPEDVTENGGPRWSCSKTTSMGDTAYVYLTGGKGITYEWLVTSPAKPNANWGHVCEVKLRRVLHPPISIQEIRQAIPENLWAAPYTNFRGMRSIKIPEDAAKALSQLRP